MAYPPNPLNTGRTDNTPAGAGVHAGDHNAVNGAVNDIVTLLGTNPKGNYTDVESRLQPMVVSVEHGSFAASPRPVGVGVVMWVGDVEPTNALDGDVWIDTT